MIVVNREDDYFERTPIEKQRVCCNCRNRRTSERVSKCMIDGHYIGYVQCFTNWCRHWAPDEWKWIGGETDLKGKDDKLILEEVKEIMPVVRCKECKHRYESECPMYHEEWFTIDEGDGCWDNDFRIIDETQDYGFCYRGERRAP